MKLRSSHRSSGFTLVEVTLALGVAAFGLVAVFGLLPVGINTLDAAVEQSGAASVLTAAVADLRSTPATVPRGQAASTQQYHLMIPASAVPASPSASPASSTVYLTAEGLVAASSAPPSRYRLTMTGVPNSTAAKAPTYVRLKVSWPASVLPERALGSVEQIAVLDRN